MIPEKYLVYQCKCVSTYFIIIIMHSCKSPRAGGGGGGGSNRLMGMCCWMGSHFHDWIDYNGVAFSIVLLEWGRIFLGFEG